MCGIAGYIGRENLNKNVIFKCLDLMKQRGPDYQSFITHYHKNNTINLFASRLSIIDLKNRSNQPIRDGDITLVFNGEIYNYLELKSELIKKGIKFKTKSRLRSTN